MNVKFFSTHKSELTVAICAAYLVTHYSNKLYQSRQERRRQERVEQQLTKVHKTLDDIAINFSQNKF